MEGDRITKDKHPEIYEWLSKNELFYSIYQHYFTLTKEGEINVYHKLYLTEEITELKYPFGYVKGDYDCSFCKKITSFICSPKEVGGCFDFRFCDKLTSLKGFPKYVKGYIELSTNVFSNNPIDKKRYNLYIDMWFELLDSVSTEERLEYINNYRDKVSYTNEIPIIPKEVINNYKIDFLLKK